LYDYSIPAYYYKGSRFYILAKYKFGKNIDFWIRFSQTYYSGLDKIGSALDEIDGNLKSEIKLQLRIKI
jgi:hypothetical protein